MKQVPVPGVLGEMQTLARMDKGQPMIGNPQNPALVEMSANW